MLTQSRSTSLTLVRDQCLELIVNGHKCCESAESKAAWHQEVLVKSRRLRRRIETWRDAQSQHDSVAPAGVMSEHVMRGRVYGRAHVIRQRLRNAGVRSAGAKALAAIITAWRIEFRINDAVQTDDCERFDCCP